LFVCFWHFAALYLGWSPWNFQTWLDVCELRKCRCQNWRASPKIFLGATVFFWNLHPKSPSSLDRSPRNFAKWDESGMKKKQSCVLCVECDLKIVAVCVCVWVMTSVVESVGLKMSPDIPGHCVHADTAETSLYRVNLKKLQHENYDISEMREHLCTKFCSFVDKTIVQKCAALCCVYWTYAKLTESQNSGRNFATALRALLQFWNHIPHTTFSEITHTVDFGWRYWSNGAPNTTFVTPLFCLHLRL